MLRLSNALCVLCHPRLYHSTSSWDLGDWLVSGDKVGAEMIAGGGWQDGIWGADRFRHLITHSYSVTL